MLEDLTTLYLRGVPRVIVREAKAEAARRGATLAALVSEALEHELHRRDEPAASRNDLAADIEWYRSQRGRLARKYAGCFVAIVDGHVIDHGKSFEELAERVFAKLPDRAVFMPLVTAEDRPLRLRSPRRAG